MDARTPLRLSLLDNAFDSLNESLAYVDRGPSHPTRWKFALLNVMHALELLLKHRLRVENELLVWENVDRPTRTASLETAVQRLVRLNLGVNEKDRQTIDRARVWRNNITHYEVDLVIEEVREVYLQTFEFFDRFLREQLGDSLTDRVRDQHLRTAADLIFEFKQEFVMFRGRQMHRRWPRMLIAAQKFETMHEGETEYRRLRWGDEIHWHDGTMRDLQPADYCRDCGTELGAFHGPMCCLENCPKCGGQLISCDCDLESDLWVLDWPEDDDFYVEDYADKEAT